MQLYLIPRQKLILGILFSYGMDVGLQETHKVIELCKNPGRYSISTVKVICVKNIIFIKMLMVLN